MICATTRNIHAAMIPLYHMISLFGLCFIVYLCIPIYLCYTTVLSNSLSGRDCRPGWFTCNLEHITRKEHDETYHFSVPHSFPTQIHSGIARIIHVSIGRRGECLVATSIGLRRLKLPLLHGESGRYAELYWASLSRDRSEHRDGKSHSEY